MGDASAPQLIVPQLTVLKEGIWQLLPLSRKGSGPGLIIITPDALSVQDSLDIKNGIPSPLVKWAEESYTVIQIQSSALQANVDAIEAGIAALETCDAVESVGRYGLVVYDVETFQRFESTIASRKEFVGVVLYGGAEQGPITTTVPSIQHLAGPKNRSQPDYGESKLPRTQRLTAHAYPSALSPGFARPSSSDFDYALEAISHTRSLTFLKHHTVLAGPIFDLEDIWDEHTYYEFTDRSVSKTMATMVQEPYVNHVPTLTGGIGREDLTHFYTHHFIFANPEDAELELISRTVGVDRVVDEFIYKFTHDRTVDWLLPGIPATGRKVEVPMMAVVNIRGDRLYHEHITWDQGTALRQIGVMADYLDWPAELGRPGKEYIDTTKRVGTSSSIKGQLGVRVPVAGVEAASKLRDKNVGASNEMFSWKMSYTV